MLLKLSLVTGLILGLCFGSCGSACSSRERASAASTQNVTVNDSQTSTPPDITVPEKGTHNGPDDTRTFDLERQVADLDCSNQDGYRFLVVEDPNRGKPGEPLIPKDLNIVEREKVVAKIKLPIPDSEVKNFSLNSIEKSKEGFEMRVEWGGGNFHYEIQFSFRCKGNNFYLFKVKNVNFSTTNPGSGDFWDKKETRETKIEPNLSIEKFVMLDYLQ